MHLWNCNQIISWPFVKLQIGLFEELIFKWFLQSLNDGLTLLSVLGFWVGFFGVFLGFFKSRWRKKNLLLHNHYHKSSVSTLMLNKSSVTNGLQNCKFNNELSLNLYVGLSLKWA